jgi:broad specificity phosphatase PhoE
MINAGEGFEINNVSFGYLNHRIVFYLLNFHVKSRHTYFVRAGTMSDEEDYKSDGPLSEQGIEYARKMTEALEKHREDERKTMIELGGPDLPLRPLTVWTSTRRRAVETAQFLFEQGYTVRQRTQLSALNPGVCEKMSERRIRQQYPEEVVKHEQDPYHHRYPRAEVRLYGFGNASVGWLTSTVLP